MGCRGFYSASVVVIYGEVADDAVIGSFLQHNHAIANRLSFILFYSPLARKFRKHNFGFVSVFTQKYDIGLVYYHFFVVCALFHQYYIRGCCVDWCFFDGSLYAFAVFHDGIVMAGIAFVVLGFPSVVQSVQSSGAVAIPSIAVSSLMAYLTEMFFGHTIAIAEERLFIFQVVIAGPDGAGLRIVHHATVILTVFIAI